MKKFPWGTVSALVLLAILIAMAPKNSKISTGAPVASVEKIQPEHQVGSAVKVVKPASKAATATIRINSMELDLTTLATNKSMSFSNKN